MQKPYIKDYKNGWTTVGGTGDFSVFKTFDCGQCFRFDPAPQPEYKNQVIGIAHKKSISLADGEKEGELLIKTTPEDFEKTWLSYLALDTDYNLINQGIMSALSGEDAKHMKRAVDASKGIRILRQEKWEALCSFIISQNNNIPRIKKIIGEMCRQYGDKIDGGYAFPTPEALAAAGENAIFDLKTGFRAKYIYDAAVKVSSGEINLNNIYSAQSYSKAEQMLLSIKGVGPKVAACTLLFGFERLDAFPVDVWIKRVIEKRFPNGIDHTVFGKHAGVAQQYLFYFERYIGD